MDSSPRPASKQSVFWKVCFYTYAVFALVELSFSYYFMKQIYGGLPGELNWPSITETIKLAIHIITLLALFGFVYYKRILHYWVWRIWWIFLIIVLVVTSTGFVGELLVIASTINSLGLLGVTGLIVAFFNFSLTVIVMIMIFRYAYKSPQLWRNTF
jgi:hypothetical protein